MASEIPLFSADLISPEVQSALPDGYTIRPLYRSDYKRGHLDVLEDLAYMGEITEEDWAKQFDNLKASNGTYYVAVIVENKNDGKIVGTGTLVVEKKFLFKLGTQGHIEDIAIKAEYQGKKFGIRLIEALDHLAKEVGCYKTILDCSPKNTGFYEKCQYKQAGVEMHHYYDQLAVEKGV